MRNECLNQISVLYILALVNESNPEKRTVEMIKRVID